MKGKVIDKMATLIAAGFGLAAALAWNDAIKGFFDSQPMLAVWGPWAYAILVTLIAVIATIWISKIAEKVK